MNPSDLWIDFPAIHVIVALHLKFRFISSVSLIHPIHTTQTQRFHMPALAEETVESHEKAIESVAPMIAKEPRGVLFIIKEERNNYSLVVDRISDGERRCLLEGTEPVPSRHSLVVLVVRILDRATAFQQQEKRNVPSTSSICVSDIGRVTRLLEIKNEAQLNFHH